MATLDGSRKRKKCRELLQEIAELSDKILCAKTRRGCPQPSFAINRIGTDIGVRFAAIPRWATVHPLVLALLRRQPHHQARRRHHQADQGGGYDFEIYMSLSCQNCAGRGTGAQFDVGHPLHRVQTIDGALFQDEVKNAPSWPCPPSS